MMISKLKAASQNGTSLQERATPEPPEPRVAFDAVDQIPVLTAMPAELLAVAGKTNCEVASAIYREGVRGPAMRRLLARDIVLSKTQLRFLQGLRNILVKHVADGNEPPERLQTIESLVATEHRRMMEAITTLARLEGAQPILKVVAGNAAIQVNNGGGE